MKLTILALILAAAPAFADTLTLRNGQVISGTYLGGTARQVQMQVGSQIRSFDTNTVLRIEFGSTAQAPPISSYPDDGRPTLRRRDETQAPTDDAASAPSDSGRPTLRRVTLSPPPSADTDTSSQPTLRRADTSSSDAGDSDRPVLHRMDGAGGDAPSAAAPAASSESDRPTLKRADSPAPVVAAASPAPAPSASPAPVLTAAAPASASAAPGSVEIPAGANLVVRLVDAVDSEKDKLGATFAATLDQPIQKAGQVVIAKGAAAVVKLGNSGESGTIALTVVSVTVNGRTLGVSTETLLRDSDNGGKRVRVPAGTVLSFALDSPMDL
ncbi:MAG TPA: hypothetical protein VMU19_08085 [Bryobacteraceae bacterium]|nr:hypothetical protein [Bryobacteraceae bacterium]